jgi:hypothetical protein
MTNQDKFAKAMAKKTDAELLRVLTTDQDGYEADALAAAEAEFNNRNLTVEETEKATEINAKIVAQEQYKAEEPLDSGAKLIAFLIPLKTFWAAGLYAADGYDRKAKEVGQWSFYGFCFYVVLIFLI